MNGKRFQNIYPVPPEDYDLVSVIATAIAAGDRPDSQFIIKSIKQKNPEVILTSVIAASIMAGESQQSQFIVKNIKEKIKIMEEITCCENLKSQ